jgi:5'-methylthioadenosine phosphorylase
MRDVTVGVFGGSGLYELFGEVDQIEVDTPYGPPSAPVSVSEVRTDHGSIGVAFLPRHGPDHSIPPHRINYRANVWALHSLGVRRVLAPCASGSLQPDLHPGDIVVCDQLVDRTSGRSSTFFDGPTVNHVSFAEPYCEELRSIVGERAVAAGATVHRDGTVVVIEGPRFSTRAESQWYRAQGWHVINMTQYPEAVLLRELGICCSAVAIVTDYDAGVDDRPDVGPVNQEEVYAAFAAAMPLTRRIIVDVLTALPAERSCDCAHATNGLEPDT